MNVRRILRLVKKELIQTRRDPRMLGILFLAPVFQLFLFGFAVSTDVNHVALAVFDEDRTAASRQLVARFSNSRYFDYRLGLTAPDQMEEVLDSGQAQVVLHIPRGFAKDVARRRVVQVQTLIDGTDSMTARIVAGYTNGVLQGYGGEIIRARLRAAQTVLPRVPMVEGRVRVWYNPELRSVFFMVPGVLCMILLIITMMLTSLAIVKEKELGTLEQLVVTPLTAGELMLGKTIPFLLIGLIDMVLVILVAVFGFHIYVAGSIPLLFALSILFLMTTLGMGIFISTISHTQHEATLTSFFFLLPFILLSGFMFPIENMPLVIQGITCFIPMRYFLQIIRGIFLRGVGFDVLWPQVLILAAFGISIITLAALRFRKRLG